MATSRIKALARTICKVPPATRPTRSVSSGTSASPLSRSTAHNSHELGIFALYLQPVGPAASACTRTGDELGGTTKLNSWLAGRRSHGRSRSTFHVTRRLSRHAVAAGAPISPRAFGSFGSFGSPSFSSRTRESHCYVRAYYSPYRTRRFTTSIASTE